MKNKYKSESFKKLYNSFLRAYKQEGNIYNSVIDSINTDYEHNLIPKEIDKVIILQIFEDASIEYFSKEIKVLTEKEYFNEKSDI